MHFLMWTSIDITIVYDLHCRSLGSIKERGWECQGYISSKSELGQSTLEEITET